jgi:hypothetical protein
MKIFAVTVSVLLLAAGALAQVPTAPLETSKSDVYVGFVATYPDYGNSFTSLRFNGGEVAYTKSFFPHVELSATGDFAMGTTYSVKQFSGMVGPKINILTGKIRPYGIAQAGFSLQNSDGMYAADHHPPAPAGKSLTEDGFTYRFGGGVDWQLKRRIYWRIVQADIQVMPWGRHTPWYTNVGTGLGYRF